MTDPIELAGVQFPTADGGRRSSTAASEKILAAAVESLAPDFARAIRAEPHWRKRYGKYLVDLVTLGINRGESALPIVTDGLRAVHESFRFFRDGEKTSPREAMERFTSPLFQTGFVRGQGKLPGRLEIPFRGAVLHGDTLDRQIDVWLEGGVMEPSAGEALRLVSRRTDWLDLRDLHFVLLGAAAEVGPAQVLSQLGANVVAIDLDRADVWKKLLGMAKRGAGTMTFPLREAVPADADDERLAEAAGADLITMAPEIRTWLASLDHDFCIGGYAYLHGQDHVRVEVAMDAIMEDLTARRPSTALAFLLTPTDVFAVPEEAARRARENYAAAGLRRLWREPVRALTRDRLYAPNTPGDVTDPDDNVYGLYDGVVPQQGPNYALAKRIQKWRALAARAAGHTVSANVAPSTATASVLTRKDFAAAYAGAGRYGVEIFDPDTSNAVMAALLIHDLRNDACPANPGTPLPHPLCLFMDESVHGGLWRTGLQLRSVLEIAAVRGMFSSR
jgi:hypothetical protein